MKDALAGPLGRLNGRVTTWLARIAAFVLAALAVMTFCDVIGRYFFNKPFSFTVEVTELAMGVIVYLGVGLTTHQKGHISVDILTLRLPERVRALFEVVTGVAALAFLAVMVWRVWLRATVLFEKGDHTQIWEIPLWPFAYVMAAGAVFFLTGVLLQVSSALAQLTSRRG